MHEDQNESLNEEKWVPKRKVKLTKSEKLAKAKHIKKILKKRLSVDCIRMLGDEDSEDENSRERPGKNSWNLNN